MRLLVSMRPGREGIADADVEAATIAPLLLDEEEAVATLALLLLRGVNGELPVNKEQRT